MLKTIENFRFDADGDVFIDVGGNVGLWTKELYDLYNKIYFIEPSEAAMTEAKNRINDTKGKVKYLKNVCSSESKLKHSLFSLSNDTGNFSIYGKELYEDKFGIKQSETDIESICLDDLIDNIPTNSKVLLKVDTEGHDLDVLLGGLNLIEKYKPIICLEIHYHMHFDQDKHDKVFNFFKKLNYNITEYKLNYGGSQLVDGYHTGDQMRDLHYHLYLTV